jgi:hypothetical protein
MPNGSILSRLGPVLRHDSARVIIRPFRPAVEPRDLMPIDKSRANHIVDRVLALPPEEAGCFRPALYVLGFHSIPFVAGKHGN